MNSDLVQLRIFYHIYVFFLKYILSYYVHIMGVQQKSFPSHQSRAMAQAASGGSLQAATPSKLRISGSSVLVCRSWELC